MMSFNPRLRWRLPFVLCLTIAFAIPTQRAAAAEQGSAGRQVEAALARMQVALAQPVATSLEAVRRGERPVPRRFASAVPGVLAGTLPVADRKRLFIATLLPLILRANEEVRAERRRLVALLARERVRPLSARETRWLSALQQRYGSEDRRILLRRVDEVPVSLALAQAVEESGWGRSRFSQLGNAVFGQRTWRKGSGIVPHRRASGQTFEVQAFDSLLDSVRSYLHNLNTHPAYTPLRRDRADFRAHGLAPRGLLLAASLEKYSERGQAYVETLRVLIRSNRLQPFDFARLAPALPADRQRRS